MENKAIEFYRELQLNPICPNCGQKCKTLSGLGTHYKRTHGKHLKDWLFEANPNYCKNCGDQIKGRVQDVYRVNFCCLSCKSTGEFNSRHGAILSDELKEKMGAPKKGKPLTEKHKQKIKTWLSLNGAPLKGRTHSDENKALMSKASKERVAKYGHPFKGKKHSEESKRNMSDGHRRRMSESWDGNFSKFCAILRTYLYDLWTRPILERDNFKCQECGAIRDLSVHHIKRFRGLILEIFEAHPSLDLTITEHRWRLHDLCMKSSSILDLNNGTTLCIDCHRQEHRAAA